MTQQTEIQEKTTYEIPEPFYYRMEKHITKLNNKAARFGMSPIEVTEIGREQYILDDELGIQFDMVSIEISGITPKIDGWEFIATIDHGTGEDGNPVNMIRAFPGKSVPTKYRNVEKSCDHCNRIRNRKDTYIIKSDDGQYMQIGRTCMKDFFGHKSAESIARQLSKMLGRMEEVMAELELESLDEILIAIMNESRHSTQQRYEPEFILKSVLRFSYRAIKNYGFVSSRKAKEAWFNDGIDLIKTSSRVLNFIFDKQAKSTHIDKKLLDEVSDEWEVVESAIEWAKEIDENTDNNYQYNLHALALRGVVKFKEFGLAASMLTAHWRALETAREQATKNESQFQGSIKKRQVFENLELVWEYEIESFYGLSYIYKFEDVNGNVYIWKTSKGFEVGEVVTGKATVKDHQVYNGVKQTVLTRCAFEVVGESPAATF